MINYYLNERRLKYCILSSKQCLVVRTSPGLDRRLNIYSVRFVTPRIGQTPMTASQFLHIHILQVKESLINEVVRRVKKLVRVCPNSSIYSEPHRTLRATPHPEATPHLEPHRTLRATPHPKAGEVWLRM